MTLYEQLEAVHVALQEYLERPEFSDGVASMRAMLREGPFGTLPDGQPLPPDYPLEELTLGLIRTVASDATALYERLRAHFPPPPGTRSVSSQRVISSWHGDAEPGAGDH